jgi:phosphoglycolate phosphatase/pyrophosphatase PpaX
VLHSTEFLQFDRESSGFSAIASRAIFFARDIPVAALLTSALVLHQKNCYYSSAMSTFKSVIFDVDGTILDSLPLCVEAFRLAVEPVAQRHFSDEEIFAAFGPSDEGTIRIFVPNDVETCMEQFLYHYRRLHPVMCPKPFDGITDILAELKLRHIPIGLVTGKGPKSLAITLEELGLGHYFDAIETGSPLRANKPECLRNILHKFGLSPNETVYIGDSPSDITACREVLVPIYAAAWADTADVPKLQLLQPDKIVYSVQELQKLLLG